MGGGKTTRYRAPDTFVQLLVTVKCHSLRGTTSLKKGILRRGGVPAGGVEGVNGKESDSNAGAHRPNPDHTVRPKRGSRNLH